MAKKENPLTDIEIAVGKTLLKRGFSNQDVLRQINIGRVLPINSGRISDIIKKDKQISPASEAEADVFLYKKQNYDYKTDLNPVDDSRLIAAREAICSAVDIFNSPTRLFKTENFCILANIAWTYLMHEYYARQGVSLIRIDNRTEALSDLLRREDCPLSSGIKNNLASIKEIRDAIEHNKPNIRIEKRYNAIFHACCLNFDKTICTLFGEKLSLQKELSIALQFAKHDMYQLAELQNCAVPAEIAALDAKVYGKLSEEQLNDLEYQFKVVYTQQSASKGSADIVVQFMSPDSAEGEAINNILVKQEVSDTLYPFKPSMVCEKVSAATGNKDTLHMHTKAHKKHKIRPAGKDCPVQAG